MMAAEALNSLIKDAGEVGSMSTAGPPSATGMRKRWYEDMTQDLRDRWVDKLVRVLPLTPDLVADARKIEGDIYESANSREEYNHLLTEKTSKIQEEKRTQQSPSLVFRSTSRSQSPTRLCSYFSCLSLGPRTKLHQSADKTENRRFPSQDTSVDDSHLTLDENTRQDEDETEASSHFTPELSNESGAISYRFTCPGPGVFQCKLTKLVFTMDRGGELLYKTVQWNESRHQLADKRPAGPLFDIKCPEDAVSKLHLPHCEIKPAPLCLSVVHISDDGMSFLEPLEITDTHVVVDVPHLSCFGVVLDKIKRFFRPKPIRGQVLLFHRPAYNKQSPKLNVFLLPDNVPVPEVKAQQEKAEYIEATSSCELIKGQTYSLHCSEAFKIQPESARFVLNYGPNYHKTFEIRLTPSTDEATVTVQDKKRRRVWNYHAELPSKEVSSSPPLPTQPSASQPTTAEGGATNQRDAGSTAINAKNGSVVNQPHIGHVHAAGNINMNVNNTYYGQTRARTNQTNVEEHGGEQR